MRDNNKKIKIVDSIKIENIHKDINSTIYKNT